MNKAKTVLLTFGLCTVSLICSACMSKEDNLIYDYCMTTFATGIGMADPSVCKCVVIISKQKLREKGIKPSDLEILADAQNISGALPVELYTKYLDVSTIITESQYECLREKNENDEKALLKKYGY